MDGNDYDFGELVVVQHAPHTGPSALVEVFDARARRRPWRLVDAGAGAALPPLEGVRGLLVLGGPMGVADAAEMGWLADVVDLLRTAAEAEVPVFGICLGSQLLAVSLGGEVSRRERPEIAFVPLSRTPDALDDAVFAGWPDGATSVFVHDDEVTLLPAGASPMLEGSLGTAAWRATDGHSYGVQFHPEVTAAQLAAWSDRPENQPRFAAAGVDRDEFVAEAARRERFVQAAGLALVGRWLDAVVGRGDPGLPRRRRGS